VITDTIGFRVVVCDVKTGVVVDGCVRRLEVVDSWRSCGGGYLCVHTYSSGSKFYVDTKPVTFSTILYYEFLSEFTRTSTFTGKMCGNCGNKLPFKVKLSLVLLFTKPFYLSM